MHTCIHTYIHTYIHTWIHDHTYITYMIIRAYIHTCIGNVVPHKYHMHRKCGAAQVPLVLLILLQHWYLFSTFFLFQRYFPSTCYGNNSKFLDPSCSGLSLRIDDGLQPNIGTQEHPHQKFLHVMYDHYLPTAISNSSIYIKLNLTVPARCVIPSLPTFSQRCAVSVQQLLTHDVRRRTLLGDTALALATWNTFSCMGLDIFHSTRVAHSDCDHLLAVSVKLVVDILITLHHNYNSTTLQPQLQLQYTTIYRAVVGEVTTATIATIPANTTPTTSPFGQPVASLCRPWFATTNFSYRFSIFETSATALCGTTGSDN